MPLDPEALAADVVRLVKAALAPVVTRLSSVETTLAALPAPDATLPARLEALEAKEQGLDGKDGAVGPQGVDGPPGAAGRDGRDGLPGVPGVPGEKGLDGTAGRDGVDGLGFDDLSVLHDGERLVTFRFQSGTRVKEFQVVLPALIYRGVFSDGQTYEKGDVVTYGGSSWHCAKATQTKPDFISRASDGKPMGPQGKDFWTLMVKRGENGKNGSVTEPTPFPVVKVR